MDFFRCFLLSYVACPLRTSVLEGKLFSRELRCSGMDRYRHTVGEKLQTDPGERGELHLVVPIARAGAAGGTARIGGRGRMKGKREELCMKCFYVRLSCRLLKTNSVPHLK